MKRAYLYLPLVLMMGVFSCTTAPKVPDAPPDTNEAAEPAEDIAENEADDAALADAEADDDSINNGVDGFDFLTDADMGELGLLAEANIEETPPVENEALADSDDMAIELDEPKLPEVAAAPEPPPVAPVTLPAPVTPPPAVKPPPAPPKVTPPPAPVTPTPPPAAVTPPAAAEPSPPSVAPPVPAAPPIARQPFPRDDRPELPYPNGGITGWPDEVIFSRVVRATVGQLVEIPFRGTNWVYLGEAASRRGISYDSRRLDLEGQSFVFRTEEAGDYTLKFFRQDFIRDFILNDYVQVIVGDPPETAGAGWFNPPIDRGRVIAEPRWPTSLAEAEARKLDGRPSQQQPPVPSPENVTGVTPQVRPNPPPLIQVIPASPPIGTVPPGTTLPTPTTPPAQTPTPPVQVVPAPLPAPVAQVPPQQVTPPAATVPPVTTPLEQTPPQTATPLPAEIPDDLTPEAYLGKAKEEFDAGRVDSAISYLDRFRDHFPLGSDEIWWLYGQFYEANSPSRDILTALDCYRRLTDEYPQSSRYDDARRRIAYLQRYYININ